MLCRRLALLTTWRFYSGFRGSRTPANVMVNVVVIAAPIAPVTTPVEAHVQTPAIASRVT